MVKTFFNRFELINDFFVFYRCNLMKTVDSTFNHFSKSLYKDGSRGVCEVRGFLGAWYQVPARRIGVYVSQGLGPSALNSGH